MVIFKQEKRLEKYYKYPYRDTPCQRSKFTRGNPHVRENTYRDCPVADRAPEPGEGLAVLLNGVQRLVPVREQFSY